MSNKVRKKKITGNYKVKGTITNFKFRVKIEQQKPLLAELLEHEGDTRDTNFLTEQERVFNWQEKIFSPFEINFYSDEVNCRTECQKVYHRQIKEEDVQGSQLYTYTENDSYYWENEPLTSPYKTKLAIRNQTALPALQNRKPFSERYNKAVIDNSPDETRIRTNHYLYMERSAMYVMVDLSQRDKILPSSDRDTETMLCVITYDRLHKILSVNPDFTSDDCYTITNSSGIQFNYRIEHASEKQSSLELQQQQDETRREIRERLMFKEAEISQGLPLVPPNIHKFFIKLDILSAHDFQFDGLFISYHFDLPENWSTDQKDLLYGRTQKCNLNNNSAHFSYATEILLDFHSTSVLDIKKVLPSWPQLILSVSSLDNWFRYRTEGYASVTLPALPGFYSFDISTWRPTGSIINSLRRFFTGGTYELEDITYCSIPKGHDNKMLNKSQLNVTSSGFIKLSMNIIHQTRTTNQDNDQLGFQRLSTDQLIDNIESVFEQFKAARTRMLQVRNLNIE